MASSHELNHPPIDLHEVSELQEIKVRDGLLLSPLQGDDQEAILDILDRNPEIRERVGFAAKVDSPESYYEQLDAIANDPGLIRYAIREDGSVVGLLSFWQDEGFFGQEPEPNGYGFGFFLDEKARGRGIVRSSLRAVIDRAKDSLAIGSLLAFCEDDNAKSIAALKAIGLEPTDEVYGEPSQGWQERKYRMEIDESSALKTWSR